MKQPEHIQKHLHRLWEIELEARREALEIRAAWLRLERLKLTFDRYLKERLHA